MKMEHDPVTDTIKLDFTFKDLVYPYAYGFIAGTLGGDGDALDAIVLSSEVYETGSVIKAKAIGLLKMLDRGEVDDKVICVPIDDPSSKQYSSITDIDNMTIEQWKGFWMEVARQKQKVIEILGFENQEVAKQAIKNSLK